MICGDWGIAKGEWWVSLAGEKVAESKLRKLESSTLGGQSVVTFSATCSIGDTREIIRRIPCWRGLIMAVVDARVLGRRRGAIDDGKRRGEREGG